MDGRGADQRLRRVREVDRREHERPRLRSAEPAVERDQAAPGGKGLIMFISSDNLRKGAALNAVQIAELVSSQLVAGGRAGTL